MRVSKLTTHFSLLGEQFKSATVKLKPTKAQEAVNRLKISNLKFT